MDKTTVTRIQRAVLGTMITRPAFIGEAAAKLAPEDFDIVGGNRQMFAALCDMHARGVPVSDITLTHELGDDYAAAIAGCTAEAVDEPDYFCEMLREYKQLADIQSAALSVACADDLDGASAELEKLNRLCVRRSRVPVVSAEAAAQEFLARMASQEKPQYISWGVPQLDENITAELGDFVAIGGYPSSGKTMLAMQFAVRMAKRYRVGYYSLETSTGKLTDRLIAHLAQVPLGRIKRRTFSDEDKAAVAVAASAMARLAIDFVPASGMSVRDMRAAALAQRHQVIIIDYMQLLRGAGKSRYEEVTSISMELHELAQSYGLLVIALSQLSRAERTKDGKLKRPDLSSFRESGQIEQDLDVAMLLYPADPNDNNSDRMLKLAKNKDGPRLEMEFEFRGAVQTLRPRPPGYHEEMKRVARAAREEKQAAAGRSAFRELPEDEQVRLPF